MDKKYLKDMDLDELKIAIEKNNLLFNTVYDEMHDDGNFWVNDRIDMLNKNNALLDYRIDYNDRSYIKVNDEKYSIYFDNLIYFSQNTGLEIKKDFTDLVYGFGKLVEVYDNAIDNNMSSLYFNYDKLEEDLTSILFSINERVIKELLNEYDFTVDDMVYYLKEDINDISKDLYIKDDTYIVYKTIPSHEVSYEK